METINLQNKTKALLGQIENYWFENDNIGLEKTLFHRINIPLTPFNSGLEYESQPVETEFVIEWLELNLKTPEELDNLKITSKLYNGLEASIYLGYAHNPCEIKKLNLIKIAPDFYKIEGEILIDFEFEGVAKNESFLFDTEVKFKR